MKTLYKNRKWLNASKDQTAFVSVFVESERGNHLHGEVKIADCAKIINLDVWCDDKREAKERLKKLDTLIEELSAVRSHITDFFWGEE